MGKKRPRPRRKVHARRLRAESGPPLPAGFFDRRAIEGVMWQAVDEIMGTSAPETPLRRAQTLVYQAFGRADHAERVGMARQALEICPDCADAHVLLAEHASSAHEALAHYELGVAAGERALGPAIFQEDPDISGSVLETRPYLRAAKGLPMRCGRRRGAIRRSATSARCSASIPTTTRGFASRWCRGS